MLLRPPARLAGAKVPGGLTHRAHALRTARGRAGTRPRTRTQS